MIGLSEMAAAANPALARWLTGAGLPCRPMGGEGGSIARPNIFDISEAAAARAGDLLIEFVDGAPSLILGGDARSEEHTSELQSLMRISYAVFCLKKITTIRT